MLIRPNHDPSVFRVRDPPCSKCHVNDMDFILYENHANQGTDWVQWYCKNATCGHYINVEIL
ncbi:MAG: hypothetical protein GYA24_10145 [Candidatus Lokiarchaeota archaeon]|nr:hypothetical protein [Candidatus Lokiarchaeota archaeon]